MFQTNVRRPCLSRAKSSRGKKTIRIAPFARKRLLKETAQKATIDTYRPVNAKTQLSCNTLPTAREVTRTRAAD